MEEGRDDRRLDFGTEEYEEERRRRRGHPHGSHVRPEDADVPARPVSEYVASGDRRELQAMLSAFHMGGAPVPPGAPKTEIGKHVTMAIAAAGLALTVGTTGVVVVQSNTRLYDKVEEHDKRLHTVEDRQTTNVPKLEESIRENKNQADTINALREGLIEERKQRGDDNAADRQAFDRFMQLLSAVKDKLAEVDKAVAVMQGPARRSMLTSPPERDAQVMQGR